mmetsp:Transcript_4879/g.16907  ORF Transcript_4879/g.16907 Transcript_4879/m.16907 type:complete len:1238 (-) Transcript_4879:72-3785(-)
MRAAPFVYVSPTLGFSSAIAIGCGGGEPRGTTERERGVCVCVCVCEYMPSSSKLLSRALSSSGSDADGTSVRLGGAAAAAAAKDDDGSSSAPSPPSSFALTSGAAASDSDPSEVWLDETILTSRPLSCSGASASADVPPASSLRLLRRSRARQPIDGFADEAGLRGSGTFSTRGWSRRRPRFGSSRLSARLSKSGDEEDVNRDALDPDGAFIHASDIGQETVKTNLRTQTFAGCVRSFDAAERLARSRRREALCQDSEGNTFSLRSGPVELGTLGVGISLWFDSLLGMMLLFVMMLLLTIPAWVLYLQSAQEESMYDQHLAVPLKVSAGTQAYYVAPQQQQQQQNSTAALPSATLMRAPDAAMLEITSYCDAAYTILFLLGIWTLRHLQLKTVAKLSDGALTMGRYSVVVYGLPRETATRAYASEVRLHFENLYGREKVREVVLGTDSGPLVRLFHERAGLLIARKRALALRAVSRGMNGRRRHFSALQRLRACEDAIISAWGEEQETVTETTCAFVTFRDGDSMRACVADYGTGVVAWLLQRSPKRFRNPSHPVLPHVERFDGEERPREWGKGWRIRVSQAPEPSDVVWENMGVSEVVRVLRRLGTWFLILVGIALSFLIVVYAHAQTNTLPPTVDRAKSEAYGLLRCGEIWPVEGGDSDEAALESMERLSSGASGSRCRDYVDREVFVVAVDARMVEAAGSATTDDADAEIPDVVCCAAFVCHAQYCRGQGFAKWYRGEAEVSTCDDYWYNESFRIGLFVLASAVAVICNLFLTAFIYSITAKEAHRTISKQEDSIAFKLCIAQIMNNAVIALAIFGLVEGNEDNIVFGGDHSDFNYGWYESVGAAIFRTLSLQVLLTHAYGPGRALACRLWRWLTRKSVILQHDLDRLYEPQEFDLATKYGALNGVIIVALTFSSGIPTLLCVAVLHLTLAYTVDKYVLLRLSATPPMFDASLALSSLDFLPLAAWLHSAFAVWIYSAVGGEMTTGATTTTDANESAAANPHSQFDFSSRLAVKQAQPHLISLIVMTGLAVAKANTNLFWRRRDDADNGGLPSVLEGEEAKPSIDDARLMESIVVDPLAIRNVLTQRLGSVQSLFAAAAATVAGTGGGGGSSLHASAPDLERAQRSTSAAAQWTGPRSYAMAEDPRYAELFEQTTPTEVVDRKRRELKRVRPLLARSSIEGFTVFDESAARGILDGDTSSDGTAAHTDTNGGGGGGGGAGVGESFLRGFTVAMI